jgi:hypothetical protein
MKTASVYDLYIPVGLNRGVVRLPLAMFRQASPGVEPTSIGFGSGEVLL